MKQDEPGILSPSPLSTAVSVSQAPPSCAAALRLVQEEPSAPWPASPELSWLREALELLPAPAR